MLEKVNQSAKKRTEKLVNCQEEDTAEIFVIKKRFVGMSYFFMKRNSFAPHLEHVDLTTGLPSDVFSFSVF